MRTCCVQAGGISADTGSGIGLLLCEDATIGEGARVADPQALEAPDRVQPVPERRLPLTNVPPCGSRGHLPGGAFTGDDTIIQNVGTQQCFNGGFGVEPPDGSSREGASDDRRRIESPEDEVLEVDQSPRHCHHGGVQLGDEQQWNRPPSHQFYVCTFRRDRGAQSPQGREETGDCDGGSNASEYPPTNLGGCCCTDVDECASLAGLVRATGTTSEGDGSASPACQLFKSVSFVLRGAGPESQPRPEGSRQMEKFGLIRGGGHRGSGDEVQAEGLLGEVGGVCCGLGSMEGRGARRSRGPARDMGAPQECEPNTGFSGMASAARGGATGWERCRKQSCVKVREERDALRLQVAALEKELNRLQTGLRLGGEARGWRAQLIEVERALQEERREHTNTKWLRNSTVAQLRASEKEGLLLRGEVAQLQAELSLQCKRVARHADNDAARLAFQHRKEVDGWRRERRKLVALVEAASVEAQAAGRKLSVVDAKLDHLKKAAAAANKEATQKARDLQQLAAEATSVAQRAREQLLREEQAVMEAEKAKNDAEWAASLAELRAARARQRVESLKERLEEIGLPAGARAARSVDEWMQLSDNARRVAAYRERSHLKAFLTSHPWRLVDLAWVLSELNMVEGLLEERSFYDIYFEKVRKLMKSLEVDHYGKTFALFLHYDLHLTLAKILTLSQAGSKNYDHKLDRYVSKPLIPHKWNASLVINVPRVAPPASVMWPLIRSIEAEFSVQSSEDGRLAFTPFIDVVRDILEQDPGKLGMPALSAFLGGTTRLTLVICLDATGYGRQQFNTLACRNPYMSASAQHLRTFGVGNCNDDRDGSRRLLGPNLKVINDIIKLKLEIEEAKQCMEITSKAGRLLTVRPDVLIVQDLAALRHCEHIANSGWCCCSRDFALRTTPPRKPETLQEMKSLLQECHCPTRLERFIWSHSPLPGEELPRPCTAPGCRFAHDRVSAAQELSDLLEAEAQLAKDQTKAGKAAFSKWRMAHAHSHFNVQPGAYGSPLFEHDLDDQILDSLHYGELGLPKTPWKYGILNNSSDDARQAISDRLVEWRHPLDCRRKDDGRVRTSKWFTGEAWASFCAGERGSPGGPIGIATLMLIVAEDMQRQGMCAEVEPPELTCTCGSTCVGSCAW